MIGTDDITLIKLVNFVRGRVQEAIKMMSMLLQTSRLLYRKNYASIMKPCLVMTNT